MTQKDIFSRSARRRFRDRAVDSEASDRWLNQLMVEELVDRLDVVKRNFDRALILGDCGGALAASLAARKIKTVVADLGFGACLLTGGVQCDEDRLPFANSSFDLIIAPGGLDTVNDLPGALFLIRHILKADGLFLGAMSGAGSLATLRAILGTTDETVARHHPQIDVRAAGDLLARAGFTLPVAEHQSITARYPSLFRLIADLRANAMTNALAIRHPLRFDQIAEIAQRFLIPGTQKTEEVFSLIFMTGWAANTA